LNGWWLSCSWANCYALFSKSPPSTWKSMNWSWSSYAHWTCRIVDSSLWQLFLCCWVAERFANVPYGFL
jgi:hypothetical protein